jgi:hypothetical protein
MIRRRKQIQRAVAHTDMLFPSIVGLKRLAKFIVNERSGTGLKLPRSLPASRREKSSNVSTIRINLETFRDATLRASLIFSSLTCVIASLRGPEIRVRGVRSSCDVLEKNRVFAASRLWYVRGSFGEESDTLAFGVV